VVRVLASICFCVFSIAQQELPPRDGSVRPPSATGTGIIRGRVIAGDTQAPISYVAVRLTSDPPNRVMSFVLTDRGGRFQFTGVPSGTFRLWAQPPAYLRRYLPAGYGSVDGAAGPPPFQLQSNQTLDKAEIVLPVASAISGRVLDEEGAPIADARVTALKLNDEGGEPTSQGGATTDDLGAFRLYGLTPGTFLVEARGELSGAMYGGTAFGDLTKPPGFVPTYYPGTVSRVDAQRVRVAGRGRDITGLEIRLVRSRTFDIAGVVLDSQGRPASRLRLSFWDLAAGSGGSTSLDAQARFQRRGLLPGEYLFAVEPNEYVDDDSAPREFGYARVVVSDADIEDLVITTRPGVNISGRVVFEQPPPVGLSEMQISIEETRASAAFRMRHVSRVQPDYSFLLRDLFGPLLLRINPPRGWWLKAVLLGNSDITDAPTDFQAEHSGRLQIVLTTRAASIEGTVADEKGELVRDATIVVFSGTREEWIRNSTRTRFAGIDRDGRFRLIGLRAGKYLIVALKRSPVSALSRRDPHLLLERFAKVATEVYVGDDERRTIDLKIVTPPEDRD
jgi:protocatechuate 3,4-dioxygenase beta subunit